MDVDFSATGKLPKIYEALEITFEVNGQSSKLVLETQQPLPFDPYERVRASGAVVLIDAATQHTVAAGMLREAANE